MRVEVVVGSFVFASVLSSSAGAAIHRLEARAVSDTNGAASVQSPKTDVEVVGDFAMGSAGDNTWVNGHAVANSDTGLLLFNVNGGAKPAAGTNSSTPNNWRPGARIWETLSAGTTKPSSVSASLIVSSSGSLQTPQGGSETFEATLILGPCRAFLSHRVVSGPGAVQPPDVVLTDCTSTGFTANVSGTRLTVSGPMKFTTIDVDATITLQNLYSGYYDGTADAQMNGYLTVSGENGDLVGTSPTFGTAAPGKDAGAPTPSGDSGTNAPDANAPDATTSTSSEPGQSSCTVGRTGSDRGVAFALVGGALTAIGIARRRRRR